MSLISRICALPPDYLRACCVDAEAAGVRHLVFVPKSYDPTLFAALEEARLAYNASPQATADDATYVAAVEAAFAAAVLASNVVVITNIMQGAKAAPSRNEAPGSGDANVRFTGADHVITWLDANVRNENSRFYEALKNQQGYVLYYVTGRNIHRTPTSGTGSAEVVVPEGKADIVHYSAEWRWSSPENEWHYPRPDSLFGCADDTGGNGWLPFSIATISPASLAEGDLPGTTDIAFTNPSLQFNDENVYGALAAFVGGPGSFYMEGNAFDWTNPAAPVVTVDITVLPVGTYTCTLVLLGPGVWEGSDNTIAFRITAS